MGRGVDMVECCRRRVHDLSAWDESPIPFPSSRVRPGPTPAHVLDPASSWSYLIAAIPGTVVTSVLWMPYVGMFSQMGGTLMFLPAVPVALLASIAGPLFVEQRVSPSGRRQ